MGFYAAQIFDEIIIKHDNDGRGRSNEEISELLIAGIRESGLVPPVRIISDEYEAIQYAIDHASKDSFVFVCADDVHGVLDFVKKAQEQKASHPTEEIYTLKDSIVS